MRHKATAPRWCKCIDELDRLLKPKGVSLEVSFNLRGEVFPLMYAIREPGSKRGRVLVVPTFCPFCRKKYPRKEPGEGPAGRGGAPRPR